MGWASSGYSTQVYAAVDYTPPFAADFKWSPGDPAPDEEINFASTSYDPEGLIVSYNWDFGDNTTGAGENVAHAYQSAGDYTVTLTVADGVGYTDNISKVVTVRTWSFALITDLHIGRGYRDYAGVGSGYSDNGTTGTEPELDYYLTERLNAAIDWINLNKDDPNYNIRFVVVLGDVADTAEKSELLKAKHVLDRLNDPDGDGDTADGIPYVPLFGNHDVWPHTEYEEAPESLVGQYFEEVFWTEDPVNNKNFDLIKGVTDNFTRQEDELGYQGSPYFQNYAFRYKTASFIGLDFVERRGAPFKKGVLAGAEMLNVTGSWLTGKLNEYAINYQGKEPVILLSHHPLATSIIDPRYTVAAFSPLELNEIRGILDGYENVDETKQQILGNFAGHLHGNEGLLWLPEEIIGANKEYDPIAGTPVVTTEALMVGSNLQDADLWTYNKGIIRIVKVLGANQINYNIIEGRYKPWMTPDEGKEFLALNPRFSFNNVGTDPPGNISISFYPKVFTKRDVFYRWDFGDNNTGEHVDEKIVHQYSAPGLYQVTVTAVDNVTSVTENLTDEILVLADVSAYLLTVPQTITATSTTIDEDLTQVARSEKDQVLIEASHSEAKPVGLITVHFERATEDIDLTAIVADYNFTTQKSVLHMPLWPPEVEESKILFLPYSDNGTIYVCPNATFLDEVTPWCPDKVVLEPGEPTNGMTAAPVTYDGQEYYLVLGFTNGGGGVNLPPVADANGPYVGEEGSPVTLTASNSTDPNDDPLQYRWDFNSDGIWDTSWLTSANVSHTWYDDYTGNVTLEVWDGELTDTATASANIANVSPNISEITAPLVPVEVNTAISANATFTDPGAGDTHVAIWDWGDNTTSEGYINPAVGTVSGNHTYTAADVYTIKLTVTDDDGGSDEAFFHYVVVYDPTAGFVTGGGWIDSPEGAYIAAPLLTGKVNFGFVAKYQQGANVPTGQTEFRFKAADLNFHSTSYEWLIVAGAKAMFKGKGTINGAGSYKFQLTAIDADINPNDNFNIDRFRIKIWDESDGTEVVIYDNALGDDSDNATTEIGGGSIIIHEG